MITIQSRRYGSLALTLVVLLAGCATAKVVENPSQPIAEYKLRQTQSGVEIAIDPIVEPPRLQQYFVKDLLRGFNILPVFVIIRNEQDAPLLVESGSFSLIDGAGLSLAQSTPIAARNTLERRAANLDAVGVAIVLPAGVLPPLSLLLLPAAVVYGAAASPGDYRDAAENIFKRALFDRVLYKGASHSGFIYFQPPERDLFKHTKALRAELRNVATDQIVVLTVDLDLSHGDATDEKATKSQ